jgi:hypothetical protein
VHAALTPRERGAYLEWLGSSSISTPDSDEMVIAFKLARRIGMHPTKVIRALRGQKGESVELRERLAGLVAADPSLTFVQDGRVRRVVFNRTVR